MSQEKYCPMCGTELNSGNCPNCGYQSPVSAGSVVPEQNDSNSTGSTTARPRKKTIIPIIIIAAIAAAIVVALLVVRPILADTTSSSGLFASEPAEPVDPIVGEWELMGTDLDGVYYDAEESQRGFGEGGDFHLVANADGSFTLQLNTATQTGTWSSVDLGMEDIEHTYLLGSTNMYFAIDEESINVGSLYNPSNSELLILLSRMGADPLASNSDAITDNSSSGNQGTNVNGHPTGK